MKKFLLLISVLFATVSSFAQGEGELISYDVKVAVNDQYCMYVKSYSDSAIAKTNLGKKLTVKYESDNESVVQPFGYAFNAVGLGTCNVTMRLSTVWEGTQDTFDPNNIVMEKTFKVTVVEDEPMKLPTFDLSWGISRADAINNQKSWNHELITDQYYSHFPNVVENNPEYIKQIEVFYNNDNFDAPITFSQFNEDDQLVATTILFAGYNKVSSTDGYVYNWLKNKGFKFAAPDGFYWNLLLTHQGVITHASWEKVIIDNVWYVALMMNYDGIDTGIDNITDENVKFDLQTVGNTIRINAPEFAGKKVTVCDINGKLVASETVMGVGNEFIVPVHGMYIVKIDGVKSVKVLL